MQTFRRRFMFCKSKNWKEPRKKKSKPNFNNTVPEFFLRDRGKPGETSVRIVCPCQGFRDDHLSIGIVTKLRFERQEIAEQTRYGAQVNVCLITD